MYMHVSRVEEEQDNELKESERGSETKRNVGQREEKRERERERTDREVRKSERERERERW